MLNVARYDVFKLGEAVLAGQVARALRMLDGLRAEGEAAVLVHWTLAEDIRSLKRVKDAMATASRCRWLREARVWGVKERLFERVVPLLGDNTLAQLLDAAQVCDGLVKGLSTRTGRTMPWAGLKRLVLMLVQQTAALPSPGRGRTAAALSACTNSVTARAVDQVRQRAPVRARPCDVAPPPSGGAARSVCAAACGSTVIRGCARTDAPPPAARCGTRRAPHGRRWPPSSAASRSASTTCAPRARFTRLRRGASAQKSSVEQAARRGGQRQQVDDDLRRRPAPRAARPAGAGRCRRLRLAAAPARHRVAIARRGAARRRPHLAQAEHRHRDLVGTALGSCAQRAARCWRR